jgi:hypothetical protein
MHEEYSQPTQPATQQVLDPRRLGRNNSGLNDGDIADVLAILHPATPTAIRIVEQAAELSPQHVLFRNSLESMTESEADIEEQETIIVNDNGERLGQSSRAGADLALRMTSARSLRFKQLGFIFEQRRYRLWSRFWQAHQQPALSNLPEQGRDSYDRRYVDQRHDCRRCFVEV